jgi:hypothetical protein
MSCRDIRLAIGAEPAAATADIEEHVAACTACREFRREMRMLDQNIARALEIDLQPLPQGERVAARARPQKIMRPRWALAASVMLAVIAGFVLWSALPRSTLARDVVDHMKFEPHAWAATLPADASAIARVLARAGLEIDSVEGGQIVFVETCLVRGKLVPHFVVRTDQGPYTVLVLSDEHVKREERFASGGYTGVLVPSSRGTIAILNRNAADPQEEANRVMRALRIADSAS